MADPDPKKIFVIFNNFIMATGKSRRNNELGDFPPTFGAIEWRRLYQAVDRDDLGYQAIAPWDASVLPNGGTDTMWCFTELQLKPDGKFHRKTESGHTWEGKTGRQKPNGYPDDINVAKFILDKQFYMLEFTLKADTNKQHTVALCKIWKRGNSTVPSPQILSPSIIVSSPEALTWSPQTPSPQTPWDPSGVFSPGTSTSHKVVLMMWHIKGSMCQNQISRHVSEPDQQARGVGIHMDIEQRVLENYFDNTGGVTGMQIDHPQAGLFHQSTGQGDESTTYQPQGLCFDITKMFESLAVLDSTKGSFGEVTSKYPAEAHKIVSMLHDLASYYSKVPGASTSGVAEGNDWSSTSWNDNAQLKEAAAVISSAAAAANLEVVTGDPPDGTTAAAAQDDVFPAADEEPNPMQEDLDMGESLFDEWELILKLDQGNGNITFG